MFQKFQIQLSIYLDSVYTYISDDSSNIVSLFKVWLSQIIILIKNKHALLQKFIIKISIVTLIIIHKNCSDTN